MELKIYTQADLKIKLELHLKWLCGEKDGERADLSSANLSSADLSYADLRYADLRYADLRSADLSYADLRSADLRSADLRSANLSYADLRSANLSYADLSSADLSYANLSYANLSYADLDYSAFPLWCGGADFKCNIKLVYQLLAHITTLKVQDEKKEFAELKKLILPYAKKSHHWEDLKFKK